METVPPEGLRVLWTREQIADGVEAIAEELVTTYGDAPTVNLVPVMTGGLHFAAALSSALERRAPGKWLISPVFAAAYVADGDVTTPSIEFPAGFEGRVDAAAPVVVVAVVSAGAAPGSSPRRSDPWASTSVRSSTRRATTSTSTWTSARPRSRWALGCGWGRRCWR